jgi:bifunctional oligoribonuclease and PAP phosphatase NrnA
MKLRTDTRFDGFCDRASGQKAPLALEGLRNIVQSAGTILIASHANPDGDALGSQAALTVALARLGKKVRSVLAEDVPGHFREVLPAGVLAVVPKDERLDRQDLCILLDANEAPRSGRFRDTIFADGQRRACLDHHPYHGVSRFDATLVLTEAPSTGNLVLKLIDALGVPLDESMARCLWVAMATDTGWFRFANTGAWVLEDAARLVDIGLDVERLYELAFQGYGEARARLLGQILVGVHAELGGALVWSFVSRSMLEAAGQRIADLDGMVDYLKLIRGPRVIALIVETGDGSYKVSLRAKDSASVESVARSLGGGGHAKAARYTHSGTWDELLAALRTAVAR